MLDQQGCMRLAATHAVDTYVHSGMVVGIGTGRTAGYATAHLSSLLRAGVLRDVRGVATSESSQRLMSDLGIPSLSVDESPPIDVAIDGADAFDDHLCVIKGGGGALFREKLVESCAKKLVIVADESKRAKGHLLESFRLPIEVVRFGHATTMKRVADRFAPLIRRWSARVGADGSLFETDNHNVIMDVEFEPTDVAQLDADLKSIHGVVCSGLFIGMASAIVVSRRDGSISVLQ